MKKIFSFSFFFQIIYAFAQQTTGVTTEISGKQTVDTNYVRFYKHKLVIALWQSARSFDIMLTQNTIPDSGLSAINYIANSNNVTGISIDYDILSLSLGFKSVSLGNERTGNTDYFDLGLNINTKGLRLENSFKRYTGFYDKNSPKYFLPFTDSTNYFQNPSMNLQVIKSKLIYSFNKRKFALGAAYANVKRQVKSAGSWLLIGNFYASSMYADSSFIPSPLYRFYGNRWDGLNKMNVYAFSFGVGGTRTFVFWRKFYLNALLSLGIEEQYRHFYIHPEEVHFKGWKTRMASDWRTALGYNGKNFFIRVTNSIDLTNYGVSGLKFAMKFIAGSFDLGYRFNFRAPKPYRKFQESELYHKYF